MKTATGILIVSLLAIESFAVDFLLVRDGRNVWVRDSDPFAYESRVARLNGAESIADETGTYCLYEGVKYYDIDAEAEAQAALPQVFPTGIATLDDEGHHIELVPDMVDGVVVPVQISNSPLTVKDREAMKAAAVAVRVQAKAEKAALKAEVKDAKNDKAKLVAILKWIEAQ